MDDDHGNTGEEAPERECPCDHWCPHCIAPFRLEQKRDEFFTRIRSEAFPEESVPEDPEAT